MELVVLPSKNTLLTTTKLTFGSQNSTHIPQTWQHSPLANYVMHNAQEHSQIPLSKSHATMKQFCKEPEQHMTTSGWHAEIPNTMSDSSPWKIIKNKRKITATS